MVLALGMIGCQSVPKNPYMALEAGTPIQVSPGDPTTQELIRQEITKFYQWLQATDQLVRQIRPYKFPEPRQLNPKTMKPLPVPKVDPTKNQPTLKNLKGKKLEETKDENRSVHNQPQAQGLVQ